MLVMTSKKMITMMLAKAVKLMIILANMVKKKMMMTVRGGSEQKTLEVNTSQWKTSAVLKVKPSKSQYIRLRRTHDIPNRSH